MFEVSLKSPKLKQYIQRILNKKTDEPITDDDLKSISSLKLNKEQLDDINIQDLIFFENLQSLSLSDINIGQKEVSILNKLQKIQTLSISNAKINLEQVQYLNTSLENIIFVNCEGVNVQNFNSNKTLSSLTIVNCKNIQLDDIYSLENLKEINLPNNQDLEDKDITDIWKIKSLERVNLDGDKNISDTKHPGINISHKDRYNPTESKDWNLHTEKRPEITLDSITKLSPEQIRSLSGANINITASDMELLKSEDVQKIVTELRKSNKFNLTVNTTADLNMENMEALNNLCKFDRVHVKTGWPVTQDKGYSYQTYKAIKQEMTKMLEDIDPNLPEQQKYIEFRKRVTSKIQYDYATLKASPNDHDYYASRNLENALLHHTCVCAGYADLMKNGLAELGIPAKYVEGYTNTGELHAWIQVNLKGDDGQQHWYNDDPTFDATGTNKFDYCLVDDKTFSKTHRYIPQRTEGGRVYSCNAEAPAAVRAEKHRKPSSQNREEEER